jgi:hypothetical protein
LRSQTWTKPPPTGGEELDTITALSPTHLVVTGFDHTNYLYDGVGSITWRRNGNRWRSTSGQRRRLLVAVTLDTTGTPWAVLIQSVPLSRLQHATGLSLRYVSLIRRGERTPHPRHWRRCARQPKSGSSLGSATQTPTISAGGYEPTIDDGFRERAMAGLWAFLALDDRSP